jgi:hypothetical protein
MPPCDSREIAHAAEAILRPQLASSAGLRNGA